MYVNPDRQANSQTDEFNIQLSLISSWVVCGRVRRAWMDGYDVSCACVSLLRVFARRLVALYIYYIIIITMCYTQWRRTGDCVSKTIIAFVQQPS